MKGKKHLNLFAAFLSMLMVFVFTFALAPDVNAASTKSKTRTFYVLTESRTVYESSNGTTWSYTTKNTLNKKGLAKISKSTDADPTGKTVKKYVYTRKYNGNLKSAKYYVNGKLTGTVSYKYNKKGLKTSEKEYTLENGKKTLSRINTATYWSNGKLKETVYSSKGNDITVTNTYNRKGILKGKSSTTSGSTSKYKIDSKGNPIRQDSVNTMDGVKTTGIHTWTYEYDKKDNIIKEVEKYSFKRSNGNNNSGTITTKYTYSYDKNGNIIKIVEKKNTTAIDTNGNKTKTTTTATTTNKYKKIRAKRSYWRFFEN